MTWKHFFTSSLGKKYIMAGTGFFLIAFLIVHCFVNAMIFFNDGGETFNHWAHFLGTNLITRTLEVGLFAFFILHIVQGLMLERQNRLARPIRYAVSHPQRNSKWYSRSMGLLGTLILLFLIIHIKHFWIHSRLGGDFGITPLEETSLFDYSNQEVGNLYQSMQQVFQGHLLVVIVYLLGVASLFWHLLQGFQSAFHTFGLNHNKYTPTIKKLGFIYALVICVLFALMPISIYMNWIN